MHIDIAKIKELENKAKELEPVAEERYKLITKVNKITESFLEDLEESSAYSSDRKSIADLELPFKNEGMDPDEIFSMVVKSVDTPGINPASGGHLGYIPGGGLYTSALGDYWADITNRYSGIFYADPGAVKIENELIRWMINLVGFPDTAWGNLASGGSIANLTAVIAAREAKKITPENIRKSVIYFSDQTHHSITKAIKIAGMEFAHIQKIPLTNELRIDPHLFHDIVENDINNGRKPFLLISSAGTTDAGIIDPIKELSKVCQTFDIWHHVDGAYGGFFLLSETLKSKLKDINSADSIVLDPHKSLFLPYGLGVILVKDAQFLQSAFSYQANYMQDAIEVEEEISPADVSPELTKHFRGLRMWLPLRIHGLAPFRAALEEKHLLAKYFYEKITLIPGFEAYQPPDLSVVMFRYGVGKNINETNKRLISDIHQDGRVFLSSTTINGNLWLRVAILVFRTHLQTIDKTLVLLTEKIEHITSKSSIN